MRPWNGREITIDSSSRADGNCKVGAIFIALA
jgi:hypothetical protein